MAPRRKYNPKTNRWETQEVPVPVGTDVTAGDGQPWEWSDIPTTTTPQNKPNIPKNVPASRGQKKPKTLRERFPGESQFPGAKMNQPINMNQAVNETLDGGINNDLLMRILSGDGGGSGAPKPRTTAQKVASAKKYGRENLALAKKFYGQQQTQANEAINSATREFLQNMGQSTAYNQVPLVTVPPALQGLQQNLLAYGATGQEAATQQAQDQQAADMYTALANRGATQLGNAEIAYMDALRRAGLGAQTAGLQGVSGNVNQLQNAVMMANLQAILQAQQ